jgi:DNA repair exonuclease SbcCD ATPase subunit
MSCPHCDNHVYLNGKTLVKTQSYNKEILNTEKEGLLLERANTVSKYTSLLAKERATELHNQELINKLTSLDYGISFYSSKVSTEPTKVTEVDQESAITLRQRLRELSNLMYIEPVKISSEHMQHSSSNWNRQVIQAKLTVAETKISTMIIEPVVPVTLTSEQGYDLLSKTSKLRDTLKRYQHLKALVLDYSKITEIEAFLVKLREGLDRYNLMKWVLLELTKIKKLHTECMAMSNEEMAISKVREVEIGLEYSMYTEATNKINRYLDEYISELFVDPIRVRLRMFKTLKDKGRIKPSVNLQATFAGEEFDISSLSGGEDERVSLAITLSLNKLSVSPFLIMDETFGSLSNNDRERSSKVIKKHGKKKNAYTLCVVQGTVEEYYDRQTYIPKL